MIERSQDFDLGRDKTRMKNPADADRQHETVDRLLERLFAQDPTQRWELQLVADEVGMGKTFVALGAAFSVLHSMRQGRDGGQLRDAQRAVIVVAPSHSLVEKWEREVSEFIGRCVEPENKESAELGFQPSRAERADDLAAMLRGKRAHGGVIITFMDVLGTSRKLTHYDLKRRFILAALFALWGDRLPAEAQRLLGNGLPEGWSFTFTEEDLELLPFASIEDAKTALGAVDPAAAKEIDELLAACNELARPHTRDRAEKFKTEVIARLADVYRAACYAGIRESVPLVIVDEAHNWKNGPSAGSHGYKGFQRWLGPLCRRAILLTATPFQLRPNEMLELLRVGECLGLDPDPALAEERRRRLAHQRTKVIDPVLSASADQSRSFAKEWARLPPARTGPLGEAWSSEAIRRACDALRAISNAEGVVDRAAVERLISPVVAGVEPDLRAIVREALRLFAFNEDLSQELGTFVIRHRRPVQHRLFQIGAEYGDPSLGVMKRGDKSILHTAPGLDVRGEAELPHYLLMRCVSEMKSGKGRSSLGTALTGCYSTLLQSAEGKSLQKKLKSGPAGAYLDLLTEMVGEAKDPVHPKVKAVTNAILAAWQAGEKTLVFCFRTHTARRLHHILEARIDRDLAERRERVIGSATALENFRSRFSRRDDELVGCGMDRVLWSLHWAARSDSLALPELEPEHLLLRDDDLRDLAELGLRYGVDLRADSLDRVFLHRATEHLLAKRILARGAKGNLVRSLLRALAEPSWVERPYGTDLTSDGDSEESDVKGVDQRGVHGIYTPTTSSLDPAAVDDLTQALRERRAHAERSKSDSVLDAYARAPSFWLGADPWAGLGLPSDNRVARTLETLHTQLLQLTRHGAELVWKERLLAFQALRQAVLRDAILVRLLPEKPDGAEDEIRSRGAVLVESLFRPMPGQEESMADKLAVFTEDLRAASGQITAPNTARGSLYEATRLRGEGQVVLVDGETGHDRRKRVFAGFNSPLLPEVLVCTQVGQEGIDLHRHCRHVIHYDLAWNPAVVEQRTGRVDRIGSKTFRERDRLVVADPATPTAGHLEVGVPYLAGTYDERMYEELRVRAQIFEVLTGGEVGMENLEGSDESEGAEGAEEAHQYPMLPTGLVEDLRVRLHVWAPPTAAHAPPSE